MINTVIFDFGNVLVRDTIDILEKEYGYARMSAAKKQAYEQGIHLCETGKITPNQLFKIIHETLTPDLSPTEVLEYVMSRNKVLSTWKLAQKLSKTHKVIILSNNFKYWPKVMMNDLGIKLGPIKFVNSAYLGIRKPHQDIYQYTIKKYKLVPEECVFIDDKIVNLVPAKKLGMKTFHYKNNLSDLKSFFKKQHVSI